MHVRIDQAADAVYLNLTGWPIEGSDEVAEGIIVDYDAEGRIDASKRTDDPYALKQFSFEVPTLS